MFTFPNSYLKNEPEHTRRLPESLVLDILLNKTSFQQNSCICIHVDIHVYVYIYIYAYNLADANKGLFRELIRMNVSTDLDEINMNYAKHS
jgi:hypothetical protein